MRYIIFFILISGLSLSLGRAEETSAIDEIIVTAVGIPAPLDHIGASIDVIDADEIAQSGKLYIQELIAQKAGVSFYQQGGAGTVSNVFLRGLRSYYVGVELDGMRITSPTQPQQMANWSYLSTSGLEQIEILRGSHSVLYGSEAIGGVIRMQSAIGGARETRVGLEAGTNVTRKLDVYSKGRYKNTDYGVGLYSFSTKGISAADAADGNSEQDGHENTSVNGRIHTDINDRLGLALSVRVSDGESEYDSAFPELADDDSVQNLKTRQARLSLIYEDEVFHHEVSLGRYEDEREETYGLYEGTRNIAESRSTYSITDNLQMAAGLYSEDTHYIYTDDAYDAMQNAAYLMVQNDWANRLWTTFALRHDQHEQFNAFTSYRATARAAFMPQLSMRASLGTGFRAPSLYELFDDFAGNEDLHPEESMSADIGFILTPLQNITLDIGAFYTEIDHLIIYDDVESFTYKQSNLNNEAHGAEVKIDWARGHYMSMMANYTYTDAHQEGARAPRRPRHQLGVAGYYKLGQAINLGADITAIYDVIDTDGAPLDNYVLMGGKLDYHVDEAVIFTLRIENISDADYQTARGYGTPGRAVYIGLKAAY